MLISHEWILMIMKKKNDTYFPDHTHNLHSHSKALNKTWRKYEILYTNEILQFFIEINTRKWILFWDGVECILEDYFDTEPSIS